MHKGTMPQDNNKAVQAAAPASAQQCLQAPADASAWHPAEDTGKEMAQGKLRRNRA